MPRYCKYGFDYNRSTDKNAFATDAEEVIRIVLESLLYRPAEDRLEFHVRTIESHDGPGE